MTSQVTEFKPRALTGASGQTTRIQVAGVSGKDRMSPARSIGGPAIIAAFLGAGAGLCLGWLGAIIGVTPWGLLLPLVSAVGIALLQLIYGIDRSSFPPLQWTGQLSIWVKLGLVVLIVAVTLALVQAFNLNPRHYAYSLLLPPVVVCAVLFGFTPSMFAVVLCTVAAAYFYAPPKYSFVIAHWRDVVGLATFALVGGFCGLILGKFFEVPD